MNNVKSIKISRVSEKFIGLYSVAFFAVFFFLCWRIYPFDYDIYGGKIENGKYYFETVKGKSSWKEVTKTDYDRSVAFDQTCVALLAFWGVTFCIMSYPEYQKICEEKRRAKEQKESS